MTTDSKVPRILAGVDVRRLPLRSLDVIVVARIDGTSTIEELADVLGVSEDEVDASVGRLDMLGAIEWVTRAPAPRAVPRVDPPPQRPGAPRPPQRPVTLGDRPAAAAPQGAPQRPVTLGDRSAPAHTSPQRPVTLGEGSAHRGGVPLVTQASPSPTPPTAPSAAAEDIELDPERRARIDALIGRLDGIDHYTLLGLGSDADKTEVRTAYFGLSKQFHPDTAFGKKLGPYKARMETIFHRLTEAYDVLSKSKRRAEYDEALTRAGRFPVARPLVPPAGTIDAPKPDARTPLGTRISDLPPARPDIAPPRAPSPTRPDVAPPRPPAHAAPEPPPAAPEPTRTPPAPELRPEAVSPVAQGPATPRTPVPPAARPVPGSRPQGPASHTLRNLASSLKAAGQITGTTDKVQRYVRDARAAEAENDLSQALNCLKLARQLAPDRADLATEYERVYRLFVTMHADDLRRRALADEKAGRLAEATQAWLRVCDGRPNDLEAHYAAGRAALASRTELVRARGYLQRAVSLAPHVAEGRIVLARLYLANGQRAEAVREAEAAAKLYPDDQMLKNLIRELKA